MDPRVRLQAEVLADHSTEIGPGDQVLIRAPAMATDLVIALYECIGEREAVPLSLLQSERAHRAYVRAFPSDEFDLTSHQERAIRESDVLITIKGSENTYETSDVPADRLAAFDGQQGAVREALLDSRWVTTQYPAPADAQAARMSIEGYRSFVWDAIDKDWAAQRKLQEQLVEVLEPAEEIVIRSGDETDLRMRTDGMKVFNDYGQHNMPGGEVSTAPVVDSVEGTVLFDKPLMVQGREVTDVYLEFEEGEVTDHAAAQNEDALTSVLETDAGARRIGELGIGMNRDIDRFTYNMLFDEKMDQTVHLALGRAYDQLVGPDREVNRSAIHRDMIVDMSEDCVLEVDGEAVQTDGTFVFES